MLNDIKVVFAQTVNIVRGALHWHHSLGQLLSFQLKLPQFYLCFRLNLQLPYLQMKLLVGFAGLLLRLQLEASKTYLHPCRVLLCGRTTEE